MEKEHTVDELYIAYLKGYNAAKKDYKQLKKHLCNKLLNAKNPNIYSNIKEMIVLLEKYLEREK